MDDALSGRDTEDITLAAISSPSFKLYDDIRREMLTDNDMQRLHDQIAAGELGTPWRVEDGLIVHGHRVFVSASSPLLPTLLHMALGTGHEGIQKTLHRLRVYFFVHHDHALVRDFVQTCATCQRNKTEAFHLAGLLQPL